MARVEGLLKAVGAEGKFGDYVTYRLNGKLVMRRIGKMEKEVYAKSPSFEQLRQNQSEFGLASQISKNLRLALGEYGKLWCDRYCSGRLTGRIRKMLQQGEGEKGQRSFDIKNLSLLHEFPLDKTKPARALLTTAGNLSHDKDKAVVRLSYSPQQLEYWFGRQLSKDQQIVLGMIALSGIYFDEGYKVAQPEWHGRVVYRTFSSVVHNLDLTLEMIYPGKGLQEHAGTVGVVGIVPKE